MLIKKIKKYLFMRSLIRRVKDKKRSTPMLECS
jgi:hypothetical protein